MGNGISAADRGESSSRLSALDGIRGVAILMVVALHVGYILHPPGQGLPRTYVPGGFAGVDVFFVLSGFLITTLLLQEKRRTGELSLGKFYARRSFRLLPALALLLAAHFVYALYEGLSFRGEIEALSSIAFYSSNFTQSFHLYMPSELSHTWTLALEEQFYLLWPSLLILAFAVAYRRRRSAPAMLATLGVALIVNDITRILVWRTEGYPAAYMLPYCHADGLIIGCMLAFMVQQGYAPTKRMQTAGWLGFAGLVAFALFWVQGSSANSAFYGVYTLIAVAAALFISGALVEGGSLNKFLSWSPLVAVGRVSYGLYLWHAFILTVLIQHTLGLGRWPRVAFGLALSVAATFVSWRFVEQPALRLKRRFQSEPATFVPAQAP